MTDPTDLESRVAALEASVQVLQQTIAELRKALDDRPTPSVPVMRSLGMLDRPKPGR